MTDVALRNALERMEIIDLHISSAEAQISAIQADIAAAASERDRLRQFIEVWHEFAGIPVPAILHQTVDNPAMRDSIPKNKRPSNPDRDIVADAVVEIIRERGEPMTRRSLFQALASRGIEIHGKDPEMVLSTMLWRSQKKSSA